MTMRKYQLGGTIKVTLDVTVTSSTAFRTDSNSAVKNKFRTSESHFNSPHIERKKDKKVKGDFVTTEYISILVLSMMV
jgi:hypothetical protein